MPKFINGPVNYIKLVGKINNIKKNILIFMDMHIDLNNQTRCESFDSYDISQYLYNQIKNAQIPLDFFMEIRNEQIDQPKSKKRDIYIKDVIELFKTEFILEKDKVKYSKINPNVRLHYLDIRDHLHIFKLSNVVNNELLSNLTSLKNNSLTIEIKNNIIYSIKNNIYIITQYIEQLFNNKIMIQQKKHDGNFNYKSQNYYLNKIINKYNDNNIKSKINYFLNLYIIDYNAKFQSIMLNIFQNIMYYSNDINNINYINNILSYINDLNEIILKIYTIFTDVYFLRRFLDKIYITNAITYCGRYHALNYIFFLVKYCDFKIIQMYDSKGLTLDDVMNKIKNTNDFNEVYNLFLIKGETPLQCIPNVPIDPMIV